MVRYLVVLYIRCVHSKSAFQFGIYFTATRADEKLNRRNYVRMGIRVIQRAAMPPQSSNNNSSQVPQFDVPTPHVVLNKPFLLSEGKVKLEASLDKAVYSHGDSIQVNVSITNETKKTVRRLKVYKIFVYGCY